MGNEITKKYELPPDHIATAGLLGLWKIYPGVKMTKDMIKRDISVWILTRDSLSQRQPIPITDKNIIEQIFLSMRKDVLTMKDMSHNGIVKVIEVVEEGRKGIVFVTERVICSLADILARFEQVPGRYTWHSLYLEPDATITEVEISRGLLNIASGLQYLHTVKKKLHLNVSPESIVLTPSGQWKLCGFGFSVAMQNDETRVALPYFLTTNTSNKNIRTEPDLHFCGPEMSEGANHPSAGEATIRYGTPSSDIFSLGLLSYEIYKYNLVVAPQGRTFTSLLQVNNNSLLDHANTIIQIIERLDYSFIPNGLKQLLMGMLQPNPIARVTGLDVINNPFFHSGDLTVFKTMDDISVKDIGTQSSLLSSLPNQINHFNPRILENTILPVICSLGVTNPALWVYTLPVIAFISTKITTNSFLRVATNSIISGLAVTDLTDTIFAFVRHMELLLEKFDNNFFTTYVIPMICNGIDKQGATSLQVTTISVLIDDRVLKAIDQNKFITEIIPRVCREACKNNDSDVKLRGLYLLKVTANRFDRVFITKNIFPSLKHIIEKSPGPVVITACVGVYDSMMSSVTIETLCTDVLPVLLPVLVDRTISRDQFEMILNRILFIQQQILTARTTEINIPDIIISKNEKPNGYFFKEDSDKAKGLTISVGLSNSMLTPTSFNNLSIPSSLPPSIPFSPPPSIPSVPPPSIPFSPPQPSIPSVPPPIPPSIPSVPPPIVPITSPSIPPPIPPSIPSVPPPIPPSIPSALPPVIPQNPPITSPPPPPIPSSIPDYSSLSNSSSTSTIASFLNTSSSTINSTSIDSYAPPPVPPSTSLPPQNDIDMDDFMSSFAKSPTQPATPLSSGFSNPTSSVSSTSASTSASKRTPYSDKPKKSTIPPPGGSKTSTSSSSRPAVNGMDDLFGSLTIAQPSPTGYNASTTTSAPLSSNSLEEQFRKNQEEIARLQQQQQQQQFGSVPLSSPLSSSSSSSSSSSFPQQTPLQPPLQQQQQQYGNFPSQGMPTMQYGTQPQTSMNTNMNINYGSQPIYGNQPVPNQYNAPQQSFGYGAPQTNQFQGMYGVQQQQQYPPQQQIYQGGYQQQQQQQQTNQYTSQQGYGYSSPPYNTSTPTNAAAGYRPPQISAPPSSNQKKSDPFDFLS